VIKTLFLLKPLPPEIQRFAKRGCGREIEVGTLNPVG